MIKEILTESGIKPLQDTLYPDYVGTDILRRMVPREIPFTDIPGSLAIGYVSNDNPIVVILEQLRQKNITKVYLGERIIQDVTNVSFAEH